MTAKEWNEKYPVGQPVTLYDDLGQPHKTHTRSIAWTQATGDVLVKVNGISGGYLLERIQPRDDEAGKFYVLLRHPAGPPVLMTMETVEDNEVDRFEYKTEAVDAAEANSLGQHFGYIILWEKPDKTFAIVADRFGHGGE